MTLRCSAAGSLLGLVLLAGCAATKDSAQADARGSDAPAAPAPLLDLAASWLAGSFTSAPQAAVDDRYLPVLLHHEPIWTDRADGRWFYVEQALAEAADKPYRQRIYRLWIRPDGRLESTVYEMPAPERFVGAWARPDDFGVLVPTMLVRRDGCEVVFDHIGQDETQGRTGKKTCPSDLRGAAYATSEVVLTPDEIRSWDRGYDTQGRQVWGAQDGPYVFSRAESFGR
jgi:hypothetical protein